MQLSFRDGRLMAGYLYFQKGPHTTVARTKREPDGMNVDFAADGTPLGIEFIAPSKITMERVNTLLQALGQSPASLDELWPMLGPKGIKAPAA